MIDTLTRCTASAHLVARSGAAFVLAPDGATRTKALGSERIARKLHDALPGGEQPPRARTGRSCDRSCPRGSWRTRTPSCSTAASSPTSTLTTTEPTATSTPDLGDDEDAYGRVGAGATPACAWFEGRGPARRRQACWRASRRPRRPSRLSAGGSQARPRRPAAPLFLRFWGAHRKLAEPGPVPIVGDGDCRFADARRERRIDGPRCLQIVEKRDISGGTARLRRRLCVSTGAPGSRCWVPALDGSSAARLVAFVARRFRYRQRGGRRGGAVRPLVDRN